MRKVMTFLKEAAIVVKEQPGVCFAILVLGFAWELCIAGLDCKCSFEIRANEVLLLDWQK